MQLTGNLYAVKTPNKGLVGLNGLGGHPDALGVVALPMHLVYPIHDLDHLLFVGMMIHVMLVYIPKRNSTKNESQAASVRPSNLTHLLVMGQHLGQDVGMLITQGSFQHTVSVGIPAWSLGGIVDRKFQQRILGSKLPGGTLNAGIVPLLLGWLGA